MRRFKNKRFDERALKIVLAVFFLALAVPAGVLIAQAYGQLKWQAFRSTQVAAEELAARIDASLRAAIAGEDARSFGDYSFLVVEGDAAANFVQRSPLSAFPVESALPGVLGWFQVDAAGNLTTPLLPEAGVAAADYGITPAEEAQRAERVAQLRELLAQNQLARASRDEPAVPDERDELRESRNEAQDLGAVAGERQRAQPVVGAAVSGPAASPPVPSAQTNFDRFATVAESQGAAPQSRDDASERGAASREAVVRALRRAGELTQAEARSKRVEQELVPESVAPKLDALADAEANADAPKAEVAVRMFASEIDPLELGVLDTGHLVLFRNVWREGQRFVQGALVDRDAFVATAIETPYRGSSVGGNSLLRVAFQGRTLNEITTGNTYVGSLSRELAGDVLYRARLSPPFGDVELTFLVEDLPVPPGAALLAWVAVTLAAVLTVGFYLMYRFGAGQMRLARQQQDFVSAVSHELKTPLTSIRMYGEMLKAGWADDAKRQTYYDYIHSESERLSRLIENVLQLARLTRNTQRFDLRSVTVAELVDLARSKVATQVERAGFVLVVRNETPEGTTVVVDVDCAAQIFINLVDNALKFSASAADKKVELAARRLSDGSVLMTVRDYGPGVPKTQLKKIFELFYRAENELTRDTVGTGIGLALVRQLAAAMGARVDARNCEPGAEFRVEFPANAH
ncbi:MAG TPA: ATP-binding protein [Gammaproteobacteria bacterium]|nr:ATP-binding protein [Gammaproteobacteria bacterium]